MNKYAVYTYTQCVRGGGMGFWASDRLTPAAKSLYRSINVRHVSSTKHFFVTGELLVSLGFRFGNQRFGPIRGSVPLKVQPLEVRSLFCNVLWQYCNPTKESHK